MGETYASLVGRHGSIRAAARETGEPYATFHARLNREGQDPAIQSIMDGAGTSLTPKNAWVRTQDADGNKVTIHFKPEGEEAREIQDVIKDAIAEAYAAKRPKFEARKKPVKGEMLLVVDLADVHFLKLCVKSETGYTYSRDVARHRVIEGTRALLRKAKAFGVGRIMFVLGNDILHIDGAKPCTTSGTGQDTDGTIFQGFNDAKLALIDAIKECAKVADVDLVHCMSNHDWVMGWALSQSIGEHFRDHPNVNATDYNMSEAHRKYYRYGNNLVLLTHGDGAKEESLLALMTAEARQHIGECDNIYALLHHFHHKAAKRRGFRTLMTEKDHIGLTAIHTNGVPKAQREGLAIEYVRSPSPPDGWHDRNGYVNRQGVEAFMYHPHDGQDTRFTEWF